jgi:hypothetical protein
MESARVPGFTPSSSGFRFNNTFPAGIPVVNIPMPGLALAGAPVTIPVGDASNRVCGGMVDAALDLFLAQPRLRVAARHFAAGAGYAADRLLLARLIDPQP